MRTLGLLFAVLLATSAAAQTRQPAQISTLPTTSPQEFDLLDNAGVWAPFGAMSGGVFSGLAGALDLKAFGAKCDGSADDTAKIQAWLNRAAPGVRLTAPAGVCIFSAPLTVPPADNYAISGAGPGATIFRYAGSSTTANLLSIGSNAGSRSSTLLLKDFMLDSLVAMTGGYALHMENSIAVVLDNVWLDQADRDDANHGNLCGGFEYKHSGNIQWINPSIHSKRNCGDGILWYDTGGGGAAEFKIVGGSIGGQGTTVGFNNGVHLAGGVGGFRCDGTNIHGNQGGFLIDQARLAVTNREMNLGPTCALDSNVDYGLKSDDVGESGPLNVMGWIGATQAGHAVDIESSGLRLVVSGANIWQNCGSGIYLKTNQEKVRIDAASMITANGKSSLGAACTTWQAANPGIYGFGVYAAQATFATPIWSMANMLDNPAGPFNANSGLRMFAPTAYHYGGGQIGTTLSVEDTSTNLVRGGNDQSNSYWSVNNLTAAGNAVASPDGSIDATTFTTVAGTTSTVFSSVTGRFTVVSGATYTAALSLKAGVGVRYGYLSLRDNAIAQGVRVAVDLLNCTTPITQVLGAGAISKSGGFWEKGPNGDWCRIYVTGNYPSVEGNFVFTLQDTLGFNGSYTGGAGNTFSTWGAQVNAGDLTSYIPTAAAQVTKPVGTPAAAINATGINMQATPGAVFTAGVSCSGAPTASFASVNGVVTHC